MAFVHVVDRRKRRGFPAVDSSRIVRRDALATACYGTVVGAGIGLPVGVPPGGPYPVGTFGPVSGAIGGPL